MESALAEIDIGMKHTATTVATAAARFAVRMASTRCRIIWQVPACLYLSQKLYVIADSTVSYIGLLEELLGSTYTLDRSATCAIWC